MLSVLPALCEFICGFLFKSNNYEDRAQTPNICKLLMFINYKTNRNYIFADFTFLHTFIFRKN